MDEHDLMLPWRTDDPYPDVILDSTGEEVASCYSNDDCAFICKAVNNHQALVEALQSVESEIVLTGQLGELVDRVLARVGGVPK